VSARWRSPRRIGASHGVSIAANALDNAAYAACRRVASRLAVWTVWHCLRNAQVPVRVRIVRIVNDRQPIGRRVRPYDDLWQGALELESINTGALAF
jgi:hypothetical protein